MLSAKKLETLIENLKLGDVETRHSAAVALSEADERGIYPLIKALSDESPAVQDGAMQSLIKIGGETAAYMALPLLRKGAAQKNAGVVILRELGEISIPLIYDLLNDLDDDIRKFALDILGYIKTNVDYKKITPLLKNDPNPNVRTAAAAALGALKAKETIADLKTALFDDEWVAFAALLALENIATKQSLETIYNVFTLKSEILKIQAIETLGKIDSERSKQLLTSFLKQSDQHAKTAAIKSLVKLGLDPHLKNFLYDDLINMLESPDWETKLTAIQGIVVLNEKRALAKLIDTAGSLDTSYPENEEKYSAVIEAINTLGDCSSYIDILKNKELKFRGKALLLELLGKFNCKNASKELISLLQDPLRDIKRGAASALAQIADETNIDTLINTLKDDDCHVKRQTVSALGKLKNEKAIPYLIKLLKTEQCLDVIEETVKAMLNIKPNELINSAVQFNHLVKAQIAKQCDDLYTIIALSHDENELVKISAVLKLGTISNTSAQRRLHEALNDTNAEIRKAAIVSIEQSGKFSDALLKTLNDKDLWIRYHAVKAIAATSKDTHIEALKDALKDKEILVVMGAIDALCSIGTNQIHDILIQLREHEDKSVRQKVKELLSNKV
ncbi:PBS lyase HEAT domain-containing protein [Candidatus Magnetoovum chiemensis]|nr:PBS lyase HEAT domain-containing protein [Candidatus Magnetoovum chiemensis]